MAVDTASSHFSPSLYDRSDRLHSPDPRLQQQQQQQQQRLSRSPGPAAPFLPPGSGFCCAIEDDSDVEEQCIRERLLENMTAESNGGSAYGAVKQLSRGGFFGAAQNMQRIQSTQWQEQASRGEDADAATIALNRAIHDNMRQYKERTADQFRLIKFNWMISQCRRFLRLLGRLRRIVRNRALLRSVARRAVAKHSMRAWFCSYLQCVRQMELCGKIYVLKFMKKVMRGWYEQTVELRRVSKIRLRGIEKRLSLWLGWAAWQSARRARWQQQDAERALAMLRKEQTLGVWKKELSKARRLRGIHVRFCRVKTLEPLFEKWKLKVRDSSAISQ